MRRSARALALLLGAVALVGLGGAAYKLGLPRYNAYRLKQLKGHNVYDPRADADALFAAAQVRAAERGKRLLVVLGGNWCQWCLTLDAHFRENDEVKDFLAAHFEVLKLDSEGAEALDEKWGSPAQKQGVPMMVFFDSSGRVTHLQETVSLEKWGGRLLAYDASKVLAVLRARASD